MDLHARSAFCYPRVTPGATASATIRRVPTLLMTPRWLESLRPDEQNGTEWYDTQQAGLILRARGGRLIWSVRYPVGGEYKRYRVGEYPGLLLAAARKAAERTRGLAADGQDPQAERRSAREITREKARRRRLGEAVNDAVESWLADDRHGPASRWKDGYSGGAARSFMPHVRRLKRELGDRLVSELKAKEVDRFVNAPQAAATRNRARTVFNLFLAWARRQKLIERGGVELLLEDVSREKEKERSVLLTEDEMRTLVRGFDATRYGRAVRMLFLTGLRREEVLGMQWSWLDLDAGVLTIPAEGDKSARSRGEPFRVALSQQAVKLLTEQRAALFAEGIRSDYVFATSTGERPQDALKPVLNRLRGLRTNGLPASTHKLGKARVAVLRDEVTIHDIRRTVADALLNRLNVEPWIVDHVVLGHTRPKLLRTYMPRLPLDQAREALVRWADEFQGILASTGSNEAQGTQAE
jgi:integrase